MRVSKAEEYGMRLALRLAKHGGEATVRELADLEGLPQTTVAKVLARLRRVGLVDSSRGRSGGYSLSAPPEEIAVIDLVEALAEGAVLKSYCVDTSGKACERFKGCTVRHVWGGLEGVIRHFLTSLSLSDLMNPSTRATLIQDTTQNTSHHDEAPTTGRGVECQA